MFHFKFHVSLFKTLRERVIAPSVFLYRSLSVFVSLPQCFCIAPTVFLNRSHCVFESLPQCFCIAPTVFLKMKH